MVVYLAKCSMVYNRIINLLFNHYTRVCFLLFFLFSSSFITQVRHYSLVLFIHRICLKRFFFVQSFYLLFQTSISFLSQSLLNNSVFVKGTMAIYIWRKQWRVLSFYLLIRELCHFFSSFFFLLFWLFFSLLLCIILLKFNSCLLLFFFVFFWLTNWSTTLQNRQMFGEFTIFVVFFFSFSIKEIRSYIFNI